jgi:hypothetical protein
MIGSAGESLAKSLRYRWTMAVVWSSFIAQTITHEWLFL